MKKMKVQICEKCHKRVMARKNKKMKKNTDNKNYHHYHHHIKKIYRKIKDIS